MTRATATRPDWIELVKLGEANAPADAHMRALRAWLAGVAALVVVIIGVGGATRLTDSGLSITEWQPVLGALPPWSDADWQAAFAKYRDSSQYAALNKGMTLDAFKTIYWWEWGHRQLGRLIGLAYVLPLLVFLARGMVPRGLILPLLGMAALIGMQGLVGWLMVQSGLEPNRIAVSPYRLTLHLTLAFTVLGLIVWTALRLGHARARAASAMGRIAALGVVAAVYLQVVLGGLVAGTRAGLTYTTWPLMDGQLVPSGLATLSPWWRNAFENITAIQFNHRMLAYLIVALVFAHLIQIWRGRGEGRAHPAQITAFALSAAVLAQAALGVATLLYASEGRIPLGLGVAHQVGASLLLILAIVHVSRIIDGSRGKPSGRGSLRGAKRPS